MNYELEPLFRPTTEPAKTLYEALQVVVQSHHKRDIRDRLSAELEAVRCAAVSYAEQHGLSAPNLDAIRQAEKAAWGYCDYRARWINNVVMRMETS